MENLPLITIDVNHYVKDWAKLMDKEKVPRLIKVFYLGSIGQLIISENLKDATRILKKLLTVSLSATDGVLPNNKPNSSESCRRHLERLITEDRQEMENFIDSCDNDSSDTDTSTSSDDKDEVSEKKKIRRISSKQKNNCKDFKRRAQKMPKNKWEEWASTVTV